MANGPYFYLRADEELLLAQRPGRGYAVIIFLVLAAPPAIAATVVAVLAPQVELYAWGLLAFALASALVVAWRRWATSEYAVTDQRLYARHGRLATSVHFTTHDKITDLSLTQGPLARMVGVSTLVFSTAGGDVRMPGVRDALALKARAETARDAFIQKLLGAAGPRGRGAEGGGPVAPHPFHPSPSSFVPLPSSFTGPRPGYLKVGDEPAWGAKPALVSALGASRSLVGLLPVAVWLVYTRRVDATMLAGALLAGGALLLGTRLLQLQRTEYVATDRRVYARSGVVGTTVSQLTYDKITDITYHQDLLGRLLGYGGVTLSTAGGGSAPIVLRGLRDALAAKETVERLRDRYLQEAR